MVQQNSYGLNSASVSFHGVDDEFYVGYIINITHFGLLSNYQHLFTVVREHIYFHRPLVVI